MASPLRQGVPTAGPPGSMKVQPQPQSLRNYSPASLTSVLTEAPGCPASLRQTLCLVPSPHPKEAASSWQEVWAPSPVSGGSGSLFCLRRASMPKHGQV